MFSLGIPKKSKRKIMTIGNWYLRYLVDKEENLEIVKQEYEFLVKYGRISQTLKDFEFTQFELGEDCFEFDDFNPDGEILNFTEICTKIGKITVERYESFGEFLVRELIEIGRRMGKEKKVLIYVVEE
jgi:hypothetical protein